MVRKKLKQNVMDVPEPTLKGLWCNLDADNSNQLEVNEFRKFAELGALEKKDSSKNFGGLNKSHAGGGFSAVINNVALEEQGTKSMRSELDAAGYTFPVDEELTALSKVC